MTSSTSGSLPVQERAWDTRRRILAAAVRCLAEEGFAATTTSRILELAEVSRGSLLHQFPTREALLVAAVQDLASRREGGLHVEELETDDGDVDRAIEVMWASFQGPLFRAAMQLWAAAPHSPELAAALAPRERELGHRIREAIVRTFGPTLAAHPGFGDVVLVINTSMRGVAATYLFEARDPAAESMLPIWKSTARRLLASDQ